MEQFDSINGEERRSENMTDIMRRIVKIKAKGKAKDQETNMVSVFRNMAIIGGCVSQYDGWEDELSVKKICEAMQLIADVGAALDLPKLSNDELIDLGFRWWNTPDKDGNSLLLIPIYLLPSLPKGTKITSIGLDDGLDDGYGEDAIIGEVEIDDDIRMGMIPYGFIRKK